MESSVGRGVAVILVTGIALGLAHNAIGLAGRPPRGIAWFAEKTTLASFTLPDSGLTSGATVADSVESSHPEVAPPSTAGGATATTASGAGTTPRATREPGRAAGAPSAAASPTPAGSPGPQAQSPNPSVPTIPESNQPAQIDRATAKKLFDMRAALFIDARESAEYEAGHIPGAVRMTRNDALAEPERIAALPVRGRPIIAYCEGGACEASIDLAKTLIESGFRRVLVYTGGYPEWAAAGHPVERGSGQP
jgi:rhodanese-related sulfurtransferase